MDWIHINSIDQLDTIKAESFDQPVAIFKHSTTCPISSTALDRFQRNANKVTLPENIKFYYLDLLNHRDISKEIAEKFDVKHESPQLILLNQGVPTYHESHYGINIVEMVEAL